MCCGGVKYNPYVSGPLNGNPPLMPAVEVTRNANANNEHAKWYYSMIQKGIDISLGKDTEGSKEQPKIPATPEVTPKIDIVQVVPEKETPPDPEPAEGDPVIPPL